MIGESRRYSTIGKGCQMLLIAEKGPTSGGEISANEG